MVVCRNRADAFLISCAESVNALSERIFQVTQLLTIKDPVPENQEAGIYEFRCGECKDIYIGQTGRKLSTRVKEHIDAAHVQKPEKSALAKHCTDSVHHIKKAS